MDYLSLFLSFQCVDTQKVGNMGGYSVHANGNGTATPQRLQNPNPESQKSQEALDITGKKSTTMSCPRSRCTMQKSSLPCQLDIKRKSSAQPCTAAGHHCYLQTSEALPTPLYDFQTMTRSGTKAECACRHGANSAAGRPQHDSAVCGGQQGRQRGCADAPLPCLPRPRVL